MEEFGPLRAAVAQGVILVCDFGLRGSRVPATPRRSDPPLRRDDPDATARPQDDASVGDLRHQVARPVLGRRGWWAGGGECRKPVAGRRKAGRR